MPSGSPKMGMLLSVISVSISSTTIRQLSGKTVLARTFADNLDWLSMYGIYCLLAVQ